MKLPTGLLALTLTLASAAGAAEAPEELFELKSDPTPDSEYIGVVEYARTADISFESAGLLNFVAPVGRYVNGEILDSAGNVKVPGGLLARQGLSVPQADVDIAQVMIERADAVLQDSHDNYLRDKELADKHVISVKEFQETQMNYNTAIRDKAKAELELGRAQRLLETCTKYAPFNAVVSEVYMSVGSAADTGKPVMKISMIDPVRVRFSLPPEARAELDSIAVIEVYPVGADRPVIGWLEQPVLTADAIYCYADNPPGADKVTLTDGSELDSVDQLNPVRAVAGLDDLAALWVAEMTVFHDDKGSYVWRLTRLTEGHEHAAVPGVFKLERIDVELADACRRYGYILLYGVKAGSKLAADDVLVGDAPDDAADGLVVIYRPQFYPFQIGDQVRIRLRRPATPHRFSVPHATLGSNDENDGWHVMASGGDSAESRKIPVIVLERDTQFARIFSQQLAEGMRLVPVQK